MGPQGAGNQISKIDERAKGMVSVFNSILIFEILSQNGFFVQQFIKHVMRLR